MKSLNITLLGGTGFVGHHLASRLSQDGHQLTLVARKLPGPDSAFSRFDIEYRRGDVTNSETIREALSNQDAVINLVGAVKLPDDSAYFALHEEGARQVALGCRETGVERLIHISALGVDSQAPSSADRSKAAGECAVREIFPQAVILRPSLLYGADDHFLTRFEVLSRLTPVIPLFGAATRFQPLHVDDLCEAIARLVNMTGPLAPIYQAGGPDVMTLREIVVRLYRSRGRHRLVLTMPDRFALWAAMLFELLPHAPFNRDQVLLMKTDKVAHPGLPTLEVLGIRPRRLGEWLPTMSDQP